MIKRPLQNPNDLNLRRCDAKVALGVCPLMKSTVQLLPLRYGLVDNPALDPCAEIAMPYSLKSRPLGIRLLRDGWLYVIDGGSGELTEYRVYNGVVESMLFQGKEVVEDERESPLWLHLGQVMSRGEKMEFTIQKAVELGVNVITPLFSERCGVKKLLASRWRGDNLT